MLRVTSRWLKRLTPIMRKDIASQLWQARRDTPFGPERRSRTIKLTADRYWKLMRDRQDALHNVKNFAPHRLDKTKMIAAYFGYLAGQVTELGQD